MEIVDLGRGTFHRAQAPPPHPPPVWTNRSEPERAGNAASTSKAPPPAMSGHAGTQKRRPAGLDRPAGRGRFRSVDTPPEVRAVAIFGECAA